jgi:hypothetical protein
MDMKKWQEQNEDILRKPSAPQFYARGQETAQTD